MDSKRDAEAWDWCEGCLGMRRGARWREEYQQALCDECHAFARETEAAVA